MPHACHGFCKRRVPSIHQRTSFFTILLYCKDTIYNIITVYVLGVFPDVKMPKSNNADDLPQLALTNPPHALSPEFIVDGCLLHYTIKVKESFWRPAVIRFNTEYSPPPKLHYSTFWRSATRRIYNKRLEEMKQMARESFIKL
jgi:hypothetical protein